MELSDNKLWDRALELMPRGTQTMSKCPDQFVDGVYPKFADRAKGAYFYDRLGNKYLDFMCGLGPIILGYNHDKTNTAIKKQLRKGTIFSLPTLLEQELAELICDVVPCAESVRFAKNGTDSTLAAVRIARSYTGREHIAKCGYHGWGDWHGILLRPAGIPTCLSEYVHEFTYNDLSSLDKVLSQHSVAGVIMEAQSLTKPEVGFLEGVKELTHKYGAVLIFDEVVTGFRWCIGGAQEFFGVIPDLACLGKAMANGMPISAIVGKREIMNELNHCFFSMTFGGECLSLAAAIATIKELKNKDYSYIWDLGNMLSDGINSAVSYSGLNINFAGSAPRHNLTFSDEYEDPIGMKALFYQEMLKRGVFFSNVMYIQFSHTKEDIEKTICAADESFALVAENIGCIDEVLEGKKPTEIFRKNT